MGESEDSRGQNGAERPEDPTRSGLPTPHTFTRRIDRPEGSNSCTSEAEKKARRTVEEVREDDCQEARRRAKRFIEKGSCRGETRIKVLMFSHVHTGFWSPRHRSRQALLKITNLKYQGRLSLKSLSLTAVLSHLVQVLKPRSTVRESWTGCHVVDATFFATFAIVIHLL
uniref:Transmembrane protein n=1 Tax=Steinernema glaseri TaxID=37863 RepID=A0A1I7ZZX5_9BILA